MANYFHDIAPTLAKRSKLNIGLPLGGVSDKSIIAIPSDPRFDAKAGSAPSAPAGIQYGGPSDGRVFNSGGYPVSQRGSIIGAPGAGTHTLGNWESDNAVDIAAKFGTPILATQDGTISKTFASSMDWGSPKAGIQVHFNTGDNEWFYTHLSRLAKGIGVGTKVRKGQVIGYSGSANGVGHLHLGVEFGNPLDLLGLR
ncbi:Peptidase M23 [uncultured Caudovirales phage]|uniref:Peptidase M23 n=1 Tax=uncultured Caudovirales phage TaxID=2100421 RepID=A0A6J5PIN2_9CAUD|nr:Peptidase M23 [uncultured Caudovirales phage]